MAKSKQTKIVSLQMTVEWEHICYVEVPTDLKDEELRDVAWSILEIPAELETNEGPILKECWFNDDEEVETCEYVATRKGRKMSVAEVKTDKTGV